MSGLRLAIALLRIPRLFVSLLLFPLMLSILLIVIQLYTTGLVFSWVGQDPDTLSKRISHQQENNIARRLIYGEGKPLESITVCRWIESTNPKGELQEIPPSPECMPNTLDVALHVPNPETFNVDQYHELFIGNFERLHVCKSACTPHTIITPEAENERTDIFSIPAFMLLNAAQVDHTLGEQFLDLARARHEAIDNVGTLYLHAGGYTDPVQLSKISGEGALIISIASIILVGLWLAIKAHRKVLDYFARSGALLPMVATLGKKEFYSAIWTVTFFRVGAFLLASVPATYLVFSSAGSPDDWGGMFQKDPGHFALWILALFSSFSLAALIASIADLKHRHNLFAIVYRYLPLILSLLGATIWVASFLSLDFGGDIRALLTVLPIVSMAPIIVAPLFQPNLNILVLNCLLSTIGIVVLVRSNTQWFAAHLEDL